MHIAILTFQGYNELDSLIALGVLNRIKKADWRVSLCCPEAEVASMSEPRSRGDKRRGWHVRRRIVDERTLKEARADVDQQGEHGRVEEIGQDAVHRADPSHRLGDERHVGGLPGSADDGREVEEVAVVG